MYIIDRLFITQQSCKEDNDSELANYFLKNLNRLSSISATMCVKESHVSKASLNRFYIKGGFKNYKDFIYELCHEYQRICLNGDEKENHFNNGEQMTFSKEVISQFVKDIKQAKRVYFYGRIKDIHSLEYLHYYFIKNAIKIIHLLQWDTKWNSQKIEELKEDDILIVIDSQYSLSVLKEKSVIQSDMLKLIDIDNKKFKKYFIGIDSQHFTTFQTLATFQSRNSFTNKTELLYLDKQIVQSLEEHI